MAYDFNGTNQYLSTSSAPVTATPFTLFTRFFVPVVGGPVISIGQSGAGSDRFQIGMLETNRPINFASVQSGVSAVAISGNNAYAANVWYSASGLARSATDRELFLDANSVATNTDSSTPTGINALYLGARNSNGLGYYAGRIAESAIWNVALTGAEITSLSKGFKPTRVRPQNLVFYAPLIRNIQDTKGGLTITNNNTATVAAHPRVI